MFEIQIDNAAFKVFKKLPRQVKEKFLEKAQELKENPLSGEQLQGKHRQFRSLHFGLQGTAYRIIYQVFSETQTIVIRLAGTRENIYRKLEEMGR